MADAFLGCGSWRDLLEEKHMLSVPHLVGTEQASTVAGSDVAKESFGVNHSIAKIDRKSQK